MNLLFENGGAEPLLEYYCAAGAVCSVSTNSKLILAAARDSFAPLTGLPGVVDARMRLWVDPSLRSGPPWPRPHFRGLDHLVLAAFDSENMVLVDLRERRASGRLSPAMAADRGYLWRAVFPALFGIFTYTIPVAPLHCACVERAGRGLLLTGASGSGKSTLSLALAWNGFGFISDEWTYFSWREGRLQACGLSAPLKLLPDAIEHFPELAAFEPGISLNEEVAYEVKPEDAFGVRRSLQAEPEWLIFLERRQTPGFSISQVSPDQITAEFEEDVDFFAAHRFAEGRDLLVKTLQALGRISCWRLRYGGRPAEVAQELSEFIESENGNARSVRAPNLRDQPHET